MGYSFIWAASSGFWSCFLVEAKLFAMHRIPCLSHPKTISLCFQGLDLYAEESGFLWLGGPALGRKFWSGETEVEMGVSKNRGTPKMDGLYGKTLLKWMIWYHHFRKHPNGHKRPRMLMFSNVFHVGLVLRLVFWTWLSGVMEGNCSESQCSQSCPVIGLGDHRCQDTSLYCWCKKSCTSW